MSSENGNGKALTRDQLRAKLLDKKVTAGKSIPLTLFGVPVEFRQPTLGAILDARENPDAKARAAQMIIAFACVPGTNERIFEGGDLQTILDWPFGEDMMKAQEAIARLSGVDLDDVGDAKGVAAAAVELKRSPLAEGSSN